MAERCHHELHEAVHRSRVRPAQHPDDVTLLLDPGKVTASSPGIIAGGRGTRIKAASGVQPPEIAILRVERAGFEHPLDPRFRKNAVRSPHAAAQQHQAYPRLIARMDKNATAPMAAA